jgi:hypothetical protein
MSALNLNESRTKIYGWLEPGFNFSTTRNSLYPESYNIYANRPALHWIGSTVLLRPGLRFERAYDTKVYDNGTAHNQFTFTTDLIFKF